ncbi:MAG: hydantoinase/oxoprolinase family protein [Rhodospirillaceae bacterium]|nr:hydantoinase/oxoprolinase family protein [Rhodospirillaceae bacterium]MBT5081726.1 hydantoinase/oxoprolinase family protein [Rhodospirillaceae bacterium]MBT5527412.1 hydantoinase/oxoprolinase family protein [Rhodospirillaceae bacterium]MBT5880701.1 hydantoinase/oxoprolinase family protein [Rhodospirillaceae bacterium]MBT6983359.1 hydantoinase/oxoprolinase family protein [Rhodospirillaceae bacterium]
MTNAASDDWRVGVDIGGTFTDVVLWREGSENLVQVKLLTTPDDPSRAVLDGVGQALDRAGIDARQLTSVVHGTTLVANALIERKGVATGLITTTGFRDVLEIGREWRYDLFNLDIEMPPPLVPRRLCLEIDERIDANGAIDTALNLDQLPALVETFRAQNVRSIGVCLLHAYLNPAHEQAVGAALAKAMPDVTISLSSDVCPEMGEYERTSTTVANAYVHPLFRDYVERLAAALDELGYTRELLLVLSDGRGIAADVAVKYPIRLVQSGPAAGAEAARLFGELANQNDILCFDMGGTTAKACLIHDGEPERTVNFEVARETRFAEGSGLPLLIPAIDMIEIGAGGGSIAQVDQRGLLQVGPHSAGADPGPACYGRGNEHPTVTDCDLLLGYLDENAFLGGKMVLDRAAATKAVQTHLADPLGITAIEAAWGVHETVTANMAQAATIHAIERGLDATRFAMLPIGGAGPVHACSMAQKMGITRMVCPAGAGVASAIGMLAAAVSFEIGRAAPSPIASLDFTKAAGLLRDMAGEAAALVSSAGASDEEVTETFSAMMRYLGQGYEIEVPVTLEMIEAKDRDALLENFATSYRNRYGRSEAMPAEILSWRLAVTGQRSTLGETLGRRTDDQTGVPVAKGTRSVWFGDEFIDTPVYSRAGIAMGAEINGPAIIEEVESTLVLPGGFHLHVDRSMNLILDATS